MSKQDIEKGQLGLIWILSECPSKYPASNGVGRLMTLGQDLLLLCGKFAVLWTEVCAPVLWMEDDKFITATAAS